MDLINEKQYQYVKVLNDKARIIFFTAENNTDFHILSKNFMKNIDEIKSLFNLKDIGFSKQIHSNIVNIYDGTVREGDALITSDRNVAIGVFTADCVPVLIYDKVKQVCAAIHSGWKGTYNHITGKTIEILKSKYHCCMEDLYVYIGPHIRECCYQVGEELIEKFSLDETYKGLKIIEENRLNLSNCIKAQCSNKGINLEHINDVHLCTFCSEEKKGVKLHSYRKHKEKSGRLLSLIYIKD